MRLEVLNNLARDHLFMTLAANHKRAHFRFAPSPNGLLHLGHAFSALLNDHMAKECGGTFLLRIEDVDKARARPHFEQAIYDDLAWLGLRWAEPVMRQSIRDAAYEEALSQLEKLGVIYSSQISRKEIAALAAQNENWPRDPEGAPLPPIEEVGQTITAEGVAIRLNMRAALAFLEKSFADFGWRETGFSVPQPHPKAWGNVVLKTKDGLFAYHLAVVVDDAAQKISNVVRGRDLFGATAIHRVLQALLGYPAPIYHHHDLILDDQGQKLSKSIISKSLADLREQGVTPQMIRKELGFKS